MNPRITEVSLESNSIGGEGALALAAALSESVSVTRILLANQRQPVPTPAIEALVEAVSENKVTTVSDDDLTLCWRIPMVYCCKQTGRPHRDTR
jgi:hypothetical protein